jgi:hypothetical protein
MTCELLSLKEICKDALIRISASFHCARHKLRVRPGGLFVPHAIGKRLRLGICAYKNALAQGHRIGCQSEGG